MAADSPTRRLAKSLRGFRCSSVLLVSIASLLTVTTAAAASVAVPEPLLQNHHALNIHGNVTSHGATFEALPLLPLQQAPAPVNGTGARQLQARAGNTDRDDEPKATDEVWNEVLDRGKQLFCLIEADADEAANILKHTSVESQWKYKDLEAQGWVNAPAKDGVNFLTESKISEVLKFLKVTAEPTLVKWEHTTKSADSKYAPNYGNFENFYNPKDGYIAAYDVYSPSQAIKTWHNGPVPVLPPLKRWSDVSFLEYVHQAEQAKQDVNKLKYILHINIVNSVTNAVSKRALGNEERKRFPGELFTFDDHNPEEKEKALALLGTPNGAGAAWLLINHKKELHGKTLNYILVFNNDVDTPSAPDGVPCMLIAFKDEFSEIATVGESNGEVEKTALRRRDWAVNTAPADASQFETARQSGQKLMCLVNADEEEATAMLKQPAQVTFTFDDLHEWGWSNPKEAYEYDWGLIKMDSLITGLKFAEPPGMTGIHTWWVHRQAVTKNNRAYEATFGDYSQLMDVEDGAIFALNIRSPDEMQRRRRDQGRPMENMIPLRRWSDVTFLEYERLAVDFDEPVTKLKYVIHDNVVNLETRKIVVAALQARLGGDARTLQLPRWPGVTFTMDSPEGLALLGSPNGKGAAWLLINHKKQLPDKTIHSITLFASDGGEDIYDGDHLCMLIQYGDSSASAQVEERDEGYVSGSMLQGNALDVRQPGHLSLSPRMHGTTPRPSRLVSRTEDDTPASNQVWDDAVSRGKQLLRLINMSEKAADQKLDGHSQSEWTYDDLDKNGWVKDTTAKQSGTIFDRIQLQKGFEALKLPLTADAKATQLNRYTHDKNSQDGKYEATWGYYENGYDVKSGWIAALDVYSPYSMLVENDEPASDAPPLNTWSDVSFLQYQKQATDVHADIAKLEYVFSIQIINKVTNSITRRALNNRGEKGRPRWPGVTFKMDGSDENAMALLGSPNVYGTAWMLINHKKAFPNHRITSIAVVNNDATSTSQPNGKKCIVIQMDPNGGKSTSSTALTSRATRSRRSSVGGTNDYDDVKPASDKDWDKLVTKGRNLLCRMKETEAEAYQRLGTAAQSTFVYADLEKYGWTKAGEYTEDDYDFSDMKNYLPQLGFSMEPGEFVKNVPYLHSTDTEVDEVEYEHTQALFSNVYDLQNGAIFACNSRSPQGVNDELKSEGQEIITPLPPLQRWSDVSFLAWKSLAQTALQPIDKLTYVMRVNVINEVTLSTIKRAMKEKTGKVKLQPMGTTFDLNSDEGLALLATPNVLGVAWMLINHKREFPGKIVSTITVLELTGEDSWFGEPMVGVVIRLDQQQGRASSGRIIALRDTDHVRREQEDGIPLASDSQWKTSVQRGNELMCLISATEEDGSKQFGSPLQATFTSDQLKTYGWRIGSTKPVNSWWFCDLDEALTKMGFPAKPDADRVSRIVINHNTTVDADGKHYEATEATYDCVYDPVDGILFANDIHSPVAKSADLVAWGKPPIDPLPPLGRWSDVAFLLYNQQAEKTKQSLANLKYVIHHSVANVETISMWKTALKNTGKTLQRWPGAKFESGSDEFLALLGTPNGRGAAWLLATHKKEFPNKTVKSITVLLDAGGGDGSNPDLVDQPCLIIEFADKVKNPESKDPTSSLDKRHEPTQSWNGPVALQRRTDPWEMYPAADDEDWADAIETGNKLLCLIAADENAASRLLNTPAQSTWTFDDLARWGWVRRNEALLSSWSQVNDISNALQSLEFHPSPPPITVKVNYGHDHTVRGSNGVIYPETEGQYVNIYDPIDGAIFCLFTFSPAAMAMSEIPPITNVVPLSRLSDVAFVVYREYAEQARVDVSNLRYIFRHSIMNMKTIAVMKRAWEQRTGQKKFWGWPGESFTPDTEEGQALLGTPNAKAASWILINHKRELPRHRISHVTIWASTPQNTADYQMLIEFSGTSQHVKRDVAREHAFLQRHAPHVLPRNGHMNQSSELVVPPSETGPIKRHRLRRRNLSPADDKIWAAAIDEGTQFKCLVNASEADADQMLKSSGKGPAQSAWTYDQLKEYGWEIEREDQVDDYLVLNISKALKGMGFPDKPTKNSLRVYYDHTKQSTVNGVTYPSIFGRYRNYFFLDQGTIVSTASQSPLYTAQQNSPPLGPVVPLGTWSEITFQEYKQRCGKAGVPVTQLKRVIRHYITDLETEQVLRRALVNKNGNPNEQEWPGDYFDITSDEGLALLGAPSGSGEAWFLINHKKELPNHQIVGFRIFKTETDSNDMSGAAPGLAISIEFEQTSATKARSLARHDSFDLLTDLLLLEGTPEKAPVSPFIDHFHRRQSFSATSDDDWNKLVCKGKQLLDLISMTEDEATKAMDAPSQSTWTFSDLEKYGWTYEYSWNKALYSRRDLESALKELNILPFTSPSDDSTELNYWRHLKASTIDGTHYPATAGFYTNTYDPAHGLIIAEGAFSCEHMAEKQGISGPMPPMRRWSDVSYLEYQHEASKLNVPLGNLRSFFSIGIINETSNHAAERALQNIGQTRAVWPGHTFSMDTNEGKALLGTPNSLGLAWMLIQHKKEFPNKRIANITVFKDETAGQPAIFIRLQDGDSASTTGKPAVAPKPSSLKGSPVTVGSPIVVLSPRAPPKPTSLKGNAVTTSTLAALEDVSVLTSTELPSPTRPEVPPKLSSLQTRQLNPLLSVPSASSLAHTPLVLSVA